MPRNEPRGFLAAVCLTGLAVGFLPATPAAEPTAGGSPVVEARPVEDVEEIRLFEERSVSVRQGADPIEFRYRLLRPQTVVTGMRYPLILFLHGAGERGDDNRKQLAYLPRWMAEPAMRKRHPCFVVAPQCRMDERWADVSWADEKSTPQAAEPTTDLRAVDPDRVYLTGLSMGGFGTWDLAARMPDRFAAFLPICGGGDERMAATFAKRPLWCFHGDTDTAVPVQRSRDMIAALKAAGGRPKYSELKGVGHDSWTTAYRDPAVIDWLFEQRR
jgi:predicted peptidase